MKQETFEAFLEALLEATRIMESDYFILPVAYDAEHIQRERNYCYELYRLIRNLIPNNYPYTISGEIDKSGHPLIVPCCGEITPDLLVHRPGHMGPDDNLVIIEVKTITGANFNNENLGLLKDIRTINCMTSIQNGYYKGVILVFGENQDAKKQQIQQLYSQRCNTAKTLLLFHNNSNSRAEIIAP